MKHLASRGLLLSAPSSTFAAGRPVLRSALDPLLQPGEIVAERYAVEGLLGAGNLGVVYRARHVQLGAPVALEVMHPNLAQNGLVWRRFASEARALAALHNQHVVRVHDWGKLASGARYLVRDLLVGSGLPQVLARDGSLPLARSAEYVSQVCSALGDAHGAGIVHRDVRMENVFVAQYRAAEPVIKLLNFSTALFLEDRALGERAGDRSAGDRAPISVRGLAASPRRVSVRHLSPEQLRSPNAVDARSDIWSIGILLFELLAGRSLFSGLDTEQISAAISKGPLPSLDGFSIPLELNALIGRCLERDPARRPSSTDEIISELLPFSQRPTHLAFALTQPVRPRAPRPPSERRWTRSLLRVSA